MYKYKNLFINDKVKIVKSADPFTRKITSELVGEFGVITSTELGVEPSYFVYLDALKTDLFLQRDALVYHGLHVPFTPLHRVLANGDTVDAVIKGLHTKDNKSIIHAIQPQALYPICGSRTYEEFYTAMLDLAPKITCQKCLAIMYHTRRTLIESLKQKE